MTANHDYWPGTLPDKAQLMSLPSHLAEGQQQQQTPAKDKRHQRSMSRSRGDVQVSHYTKGKLKLNHELLFNHT